MDLKRELMMKRVAGLFLVMSFIATLCLAGPDHPDYAIHPVSFSNVQVNGGFWVKMKVH